MVSNFTEPKHKVMDFSNSNQDNSQGEVLKRNQKAVREFIKSQLTFSPATLCWTSEEDDSDGEGEKLAAMVRNIG